MNVRTGRVALDAASNLGITLYHGRVLYVCYINEFECYYVQDVSRTLESESFWSPPTLLLNARPMSTGVLVERDARNSSNIVS